MCIPSKFSLSITTLSGNKAQKSWVWLAWLKQERSSAPSPPRRRCWWRAKQRKGFSDYMWVEGRRQEEDEMWGKREVRASLGVCPSLVPCPAESALRLIVSGLEDVSRIGWQKQRKWAFFWISLDEASDEESGICSFYKIAIFFKNYSSKRKHNLNLLNIN